MAACNDQSFGPVSSCRPFDFTLTFQHDILIISSSVFIGAALLQIGRVADKPALGGSSRFMFRNGPHGRVCDVVGLTRALLALAYFLCTLATLAVVAASDSLQDMLMAKTALPAIAIDFCASFLLIPLTILSRQKLLQGSDVSAIYLFATALTDSCRLRTYGHFADLHSSPIFGFTLASIVFKILLLFAESTPGPKVTGSSREARASFLSRMVFWWIKDVIWTGFRQPLAMMNLDAIPARFEGSLVGAEFEKAVKKRTAKVLRKRRIKSLRSSRPRSHESSSLREADAIEMHELNNDDTSIGDGDHNWQDETARAAKNSKTLLLFAIVEAFPVAMLLPIIPRLVWTGVSLSMPYLVNKTLAFAESQLAEPSQRQPETYGWGLVGAYFLTSLITAFSSAAFQWSTDKAKILLRGALVDNIYRKSLRLHLTAAGEVGGGAVANLMSVDLERVCKAILPAHLLWNGLLQVLISIYLLYRSLGLTFLATLGSILFCMLAPPILSRGLGKLQKNWSESTDQRVNLTSSAIANAKAVKLMAYEKFIIDQLLDCRKAESEKAWPYGRKLITVSALTNLTKEISSIATFTTLLLVDHYTGSHRFNISTIVTSMTLLSLMEMPLLQMGQQFATIVSASVSLRRIQIFLAQPEYHERSNMLLQGPIRDRNSKMSEDNGPTSLFAAEFEEASMGWTRGRPALVNVSVQIPRNRLTFVCGPIGSGKSTFLQAIIGEVDVFNGRADLGILDAPVAYVSQDPWLQDNLSIRDNITLCSAFDTELYEKIISAIAFDIDLKQLPKNDETRAGELSGGQRQRVALGRALYSCVESYILDDVTSALDAETATHVWRALFGSRGLLRGKTVILSTNAMHLLRHADYVIRLDAGRLVEAGLFSDIHTEGVNFISDTESIGEADGSRQPGIPQQSGTKIVRDNEEAHEEVAQGSVNKSVFVQWFKAISIWRVIVQGVIGSLVIAGSQAGWQVYLQYFSRAQATQSGQEDQWKWLAGFISLILFTAIYFPVNTFAIFRACLIRAGPILHAQEALGVWQTSISFFEGNAPGTILNRFSQDLFILDWELPIAATNFTAALANTIMSVLLLVIPVPPLLGVVAAVSVAFVLIQRMYTPVSRQLRRLEMATKSPLYSQITETSKPAGLVTIRGLRRQEVFIETNTARLNRSQQPYYTLEAVRRWLLVMLGLLALVINVALVAIVVLMRKSSKIGILGAGLVTATQLTTELTSTVVSFTEVEIASVAVERIVGFSRLQREEGEASNGKLRQSLSRKKMAGRIDMENLTVTYKPGLKPSLNNITLSIRAGERIGICGRSGSGKSTLLLALFRMLEPLKGRILLDGQDIAELTALSLRDSMTVVPQTALILSTTVRKNLDPAGEKDDASIWKALDTCRLLDVIRALPKGLDTVLDAKLNLSAGQKQLFSLARAILRKRKVLVLDEATSSMDYDTDAAVQQVLRTQFNGCTILTVAHRIATVRDYDRIVVLSNGHIVEQDTPDNLIARPGSIFRALAQEQGVV